MDLTPRLTNVPVQLRLGTSRRLDCFRGSRPNATRRTTGDQRDTFGAAWTRCEVRDLQEELRNLSDGLAQKALKFLVKNLGVKREKR